MVPQTGDDKKHMKRNDVERRRSPRFAGRTTFFKSTELFSGTWPWQKMKQKLPDLDDMTPAQAQLDDLTRSTSKARNEVYWLCSNTNGPALVASQDKSANKWAVEIHRARRQSDKISITRNGLSAGTLSARAGRQATYFFSDD